MGAAGVAIIAIFYTLIQTIVALMKFIFWSTKVKCIAEITKLNEKKIEYDRKGKISAVKYIYSIEYELDCQKIIGEYIEHHNIDKPSKLNISDTLKIYVNKKSFKIKALRDLRGGLLTWLASVAFSIFLLGFFIFILYLING